MQPPKKSHPPIKTSLHPRSLHLERYDFDLLTQSCPELSPYVKQNKYDDTSIDFFDPEAVKMLNKALLIEYYGIKYWDIPPGYLCPPVPSRADYIHHVADLLRDHNKGTIPKGPMIKVLDIGVGANCIYPIIGNKIYGWSFVGSDIDPLAIESANNLVAANPGLTGKIEIRLQPDSRNMFEGVIQQDEYFDLVICNPPFHTSLVDAQSATLRKLENLKGTTEPAPIQNFGGQNNELWCLGGEKRFVGAMIRESKKFAKSCGWFTSLISKEENLKKIYRVLEKAKVTETKTIEMGQGNKKSRVVAWRF